MNQRGPHGTDQSSVDSGNVVHIETSETEEARGDITSLPTFSSFCFSDDKQSWKAFSETWSIVTTLTWKVDASDALIYEAFPTFAVVALAKYPQMLPFRMYQYWRGDIEFKFTTAGSPFALGQCQCAWYYDSYHDATFTHLRQNKYARSQMLHALLDAAPSNDVHLYVPYRCYRSFVPTRPARAEQQPALNIGSLTIAPLNVLQIPNGCTTSVSIIVHVRFPNSQFQGRVSEDV